MPGHQHIGLSFQRISIPRCYVWVYFICFLMMLPGTQICLLGATRHTHTQLIVGEKKKNRKYVFNWAAASISYPLSVHCTFTAFFICLITNFPLSSSVSVHCINSPFTYLPFFPFCRCAQVYAHSNNSNWCCTGWDRGHRVSGSRQSVWEYYFWVDYK